MLNAQTLCTPTGWDRRPLRDAAQFLDNRRVPIKEEERAKRRGPYPYYGASGIIDYVDDYIFEEELVLLAEDGANILNRSTPIAFRASGRLWVNNHAHVLAAREGHDNDFICYFLEAIRYDAYNTGSAQPKLNREVCESIPILLPPLPEQRRIAEILRTWDEAIEKLEALRAAKERRRKGILQNLLGIDRPFPKHWVIKPLDKIAERIRRTNDGGDHPVMTISAKSGFLMQSDKFARDMAGSSVDRYTLLREGEFAYNKGNSKTAPYGCIFPLDRPTAVIPFVYFCFKLHESLHHQFYVHLFAAGALHHQLSRLINSGVRNDGLLNLYADDFFSCEVPVPPLAEQERIARAISAANDEIALIDAEITAIQRQKRGLMQKLLTGEWRVTTEQATEAAE